MFDPPWYRRAGTTLTRSVTALSEDLRSHGRVGLCSLPQVNGVHADTFGTTDFGTDPGDENLRYFETRPKQARASFARKEDT